MHRLAHLRIRDPEHRRIHHRGVGNQRIFRLLRIDIHAARNDHIGFAVRQMQIPIRIQIPHIPQRRPPVRMIRLRRQRRIVVIRECRPIREIHRPDAPVRYKLAALIINDFDRPHHRQPHAATMREPFRRGDHRHPIRLRPGIIFQQNGPPPGNHRLLHIRRAGGGGMNRPFQRAQIIPCPHRLRQL